MSANQQAEQSTSAAAATAVAGAVAAAASSQQLPPQQHQQGQQQQQQQQLQHQLREVNVGKQPLVEPLTAGSLSSPSPSPHNKENNQVLPRAQQQQQQPPSAKSGDKKQQQLVSSLEQSITGSEDLHRSEDSTRESRSGAAALLADDSIRGQPSAAAAAAATATIPSTKVVRTIARRASPPSRISNAEKSPKREAGQLTSCPDHLHQQQQVRPTAHRHAFTDSGIETSASLSEAQRLLESTSKCACCRDDGGGGGGSSFKEREELELEVEGLAIRSRRSKRGSTDNMTLASQTIKLIPAYFVAELIGTFLLVVIGDGSAAAYVLTKRETDVFGVCLAFGVGAMIASFVSAKLSGAQVNPAATLAAALNGQLKWELVPVYMLAQYLGGFLAALVLFLNYREAISALDGGQRSAFGAGANSTGVIFATYPAPYVTAAGALLDQIVGTAVLLFSLTAVADKRNLGLEDRFQPPIVALVVGLTCLAFSPNCGAIFNPARDLAPRLLTFVFGYPSVWSPINGTYWVLAGVVGPHIGAILGVFGYKYLIGGALEANRRHMQMINGNAGANGGNNGEDEELSANGNYADTSEKKMPRLQTYTRHNVHLTTSTTLAAPAQRRKETMSDYGSAAVMR